MRKPYEWENRKATDYVKDRTRKLQDWAVIDEQIDIDSLSQKEAFELYKRALHMPEKCMAHFPPGTLVMFPDEQDIIYELSDYTISPWGSLHMIIFEAPDGSKKRKEPSILFSMKVKGTEPFVVKKNYDVREEIQRCLGPIMDDLYNRGLVHDLSVERKRIEVAVFRKAQKIVSVNTEIIAQQVRKQISDTYGIELS